jgi:hypothetical protein
MVFATSTRGHVRTGLIAGLASIMALAASACVQDQDFLIVERAVWFTERDNCTLSDNTESPLNMTADVSFNTRIGMGFIITNNQSPNPGSNTGIDDSEVMIESAEVNLSFSGGAVTGGSYELTIPSNSIAGGDSQVVFVQIPTEVTDSLRAGMSPGQFETLEMEVVFKGRKHGQTGKSKLGRIEARAFTYPIEICHGCLADCSQCGTCPTATAWVGTCGFAQGDSVYHPICDAESP